MLTYHVFDYLDNFYFIAQIDEPPTPYCFDAKLDTDDDNGDMALEIEKHARDTCAMSDWSTLEAKLNYEQHLQERSDKVDTAHRTSLSQCLPFFFAM